jgi:hypothetical protein
MLAGLARWLRAAGHDTALARSDESDAEILARCRAEERVLITRSRRLAQGFGAGVACCVLEDDDVEAQALALAQRLGLDWMADPLTRCVVDNAPLRPASEAERARAPDTARALPGPFNACPACGRLYWPGSHVRRMTARLQRWATAARGAASDSPGN